MKDMDGNSSQPFEGIILSVTGLSATQRRLVNETVTLLGGKYSGVLSPHCTHLLATISFHYPLLLIVSACTMFRAHFHMRRGLALLDAACSRTCERPSMSEYHP